MNDLEPATTGKLQTPQDTSNPSCLPHCGSVPFQNIHGAEERSHGGMPLLRWRGGMTTAIQFWPDFCQILPYIEDGMSMHELQNSLGEGTTVRLPSGRTLFKLDPYSGNPILQPQDLDLTWQENGIQKIGAVFNGGAVPFHGRIILLPRCHRQYRKSRCTDPSTGRERDCFDNYISEIWPLVSKDGIRFSRINRFVLRGDGSEHQDFCYGIEDVRIIPCDGTYLLIGCGKTGPAFRAARADRIAIYSTRDFTRVTYHGIIRAFDSRNAVLLPASDGQKPHLLLRFHPHIYIAPLEYGIEQLLNPELYADVWHHLYQRRRNYLLLEAGSLPHEREKIGPGAPPIRTERGWLLIYHAVGTIDAEVCGVYGLKAPIPRGYSICAALLDLGNPRRILRRTQLPIYIPSAPFELYGNSRYPVDIPAVVFPAGAFVCGEKLVIYAGAGDKYTVLLGCNVTYLIEYLWQYGQEAK